MGTFLKNSIRKLQKSGKLEENQQYWDRQYISLQKIINGEHSKKYQRTLTSSATGLTVEQCNLVLSNEFLEQLQNEEKSVFKRLFSFNTDDKNEAAKANLEKTN